MNVLLPATIYAVVGQEANCYWDGVVSAPLNLDQFRYNVTLTGLPGMDSSRQQNARWTFPPSAGNVGTGALRLDVHYGNALVATRTVTLRVRGVQTAQPVTRRLLAIGDSTTAGGQFLSELLRLCAGSGLTLTLVGTRGGNVPDSAGQARAVAHEAIPGWRIGWFYADPTSPFVFNGAFNFAAYLSAHSIALAAGDWVTVHLGINDVFGYTDDAACLAQIATMVTQLNAMLASIRAAVAGVRIGLCLTIPPSQDQDAFGHDYAAGQTQWRYKRNRDLWLETMLAAWSGQEASGVYLVPLNANLDTRHNMLTESVPANARSPVLVTRQSNGVHPADSGYWQIADACYAFLRGQEP